MVNFKPSRHTFGSIVGPFIACCVILFCFIGSALAAEVEAKLDRASVAAGNGALLTIKISGGNADSPQIPQVENLIVQPRGQSQQMSIINGRTSRSITYNYAVGSTVPGDYRIPPFDIEVDGEVFKTQELQLKVLAAGAAQPPAGMPQANPGGQPAPKEEKEVDSGKRFGFLTVELADNERKHAYVGEIAPVRIRAWLPADSRANLRSGIQPEGNGFTLHNVSEQPRQGYEMRDGKQYLVVTWFGGISATKAGKYPASLSVNATVAVRDNSAPKPRRRTGGPFDDPFFDNVFEDLNTPMIQKDVTLKSDDQEIEIRPLPKEGRPEGFSGAVGEFKFDTWTAPSSWKTGEPNQIQARLSGTGNFALMDAPRPVPADAWKVYPGRDEFTPRDEASFSGSKTFQFSAVPRKGGDQDLSLEFSYFDPSAGKYKTISSGVKRITVTGADLVEKKQEEIQAPPQPVKKEDRLIAQKEQLSARGNLVPLVSRPGFVTMIGFSAVAILLGPLLAWLRRWMKDPARISKKAMERATHEALGAAKRCVETGDVPGFFAAARLAIQHRLAVMWNQPAQAITLADVVARLPQDSPVARFFREADRLSYSSANTGGISNEWRSLLDESMNSLKT